jgi:excisionase family DNA binding protein
MIMEREQEPRWTGQAARSVRLLTVPQAAERLAVSEGKVWQLVSSGRLMSVKIDASRRIPDDAVDDYIAELVAEAGQARRSA